MTSGSTHDRAAEISIILHDLLRCTGYQRPECSPDQELRRQVHAKVASWGLEPSRVLDDAVAAGISMAETAYRKLTMPYRYYVALYTALVIYAEDISHRNLESIGLFAYRLVQGIPQPGAILEECAALCHEAYELWQVLSSAAITSSTIDFMNATYLENVTHDMVISPNAKRYPWFLRNMTGIGVAYAHFLFPKHISSNYNAFIQMIPELSCFLALGNDLLSFYKELLAGEAGNYMIIMALSQGRDSIDVLRETAKDLIDTSQRILAMAEGDETLVQHLHDFMDGYIQFHLAAEYRYHLDDLGFKP
ncbi:hypothetical protein M407DRAFT_22475 [Tulasnella calospora MUT 4182]|uniref:Terpene synthase n=1 Tax=Tulasnella calospora MUT 4182 TaxID=1051891 RepID=A0A0C3M3L6_9AGAM|nr:hypothetical protein M407DRAFT_22475 [Tulasnella calospora MUT 4182]